MVSLLGITTVSVTYMLQGFSFPRLILIITPVVQFILLGTFHIILLMVKHRIAGEKTIMIICADRNESSELEKKIESFMKNERVAKKLLLDMSQEKIILRRLKDMDEVYLSADIPPEFKARIIRECMGGKQVIYVVPHLFEISLINAKVVHLEDTPAFMVDTLGLTSEQAFVKRMFDIIVSFVGLVLLSPLMLITTVLIKLTSRGPAFYKQERITKGNIRFYVIKFRTMKQNAEDITGPVLSQVNDPRVTPLGRILRRTRIDELPQLINVLKGDMSLVGPRPERPFFVEQFIHDLPEYEHRFAVKAGITGYAQIAGNYGTSAEDKLRYDLMYIRHYSLLLDIKLIFRTIGVLFTPGSAYIKDPEDSQKDRVDHQTAKTAKNQVI
jgi:exopolysaccharide biosynthesis polyprenyl glycosylphosphotransferase